MVNSACIASAHAGFHRLERGGMLHITTACMYTVIIDGVVKGIGGGGGGGCMGISQMPEYRRKIELHGFTMATPSACSYIYQLLLSYVWILLKMYGSEVQSGGPYACSVYIRGFIQFVL